MTSTRQTRQTPAEFFYKHGASSYDPQTEEEVRREGAARLADAERIARNRGWSCNWEIDPTIDSSDFDDGPDAWALWCVVLRDEDGVVIGSLGGVDFGRDVEPWGQPYRRVVEAEIALEAMES